MIAGRSRFISLRWKTFLMLVLVLVVVHSSYSVIAYQQQEQQFSDERERLSERDLAALEGLVASSYQRLLELGEVLPAMALMGTAEHSDPLLALSQVINRHFERFSLNGSLDAIYLFDEQATLVEQRGLNLTLPPSVISYVLTTEKPVRNLFCAADCLTYVAFPIYLQNGRTGVLIVARTLTDIVLSFNRQRGRDIGLAFRVNDPGSEFPEWGISLKYLTQKGLNYQVLQTLVDQQSYRPEGGTFAVEYNDRAYEVVLKAPAGVQNDIAYWVLIEDLTPEREMLFRKFFSSLALAAGGLLVAAVLQLSVLRRPMTQLSDIARQLPKLAESSYEEVRGALVPDQSRRVKYPDELDMLRGSILELADQLQRLERSVLERTQKLQDRSVALERERDFVSNLLNTAQAVILAQDEQGQLVSLNGCGQRLLGISEKQLPGMHFSDLSHSEESWREHSILLSRLYKGTISQAQGETQLLNGRGESRDIAWMHSRLSNLPGSSAAVLTVGIDITERKLAERRLYWLANHDALTSLPNRLLFSNRLTAAIGQARLLNTPGAILFCDIDGFKHVNDTMGHVVGDELLKQAANRFSVLVDDNDMLARMGSDEFMILKALGTDMALAQSFASQLLDAFRRPFHIDGFEIYTTISIGISLFPEHGVDATTLVKNADTALFRSKEAGRNQSHIFQHVMGEQRDARFSLVNDLYKALERQEFYLLYQPQMDSLSGRMVGVEALLRWQHPLAGVIPPNRFIPLAEEQGLIVPIGEWVLKEACRQMKAWQDEGLENVRVGVNLAGQQLMHEGLLSMVESALEHSGLEPCYLDLEVTENFLIQQPELLLPKLVQLKEKGISLSMDDFGTGYSSLSYLKKLPVDTLKIDQSFVRDIGKDRDDEAIVRAIIALCRSLGIQVLAEGVETPRQLAFLQEQQCYLIQGYHFSKPLPATEVLAFAGVAERLQV